VQVQVLGPQHEPHEDLPVAGGVFLVWIHFGIKVIYKSINKNPLNVTSYDMNHLRIDHCNQSSNNNVSSFGIFVVIYLDQLTL